MKVAVTIIKNILKERRIKCGVAGSKAMMDLNGPLGLFFILQSGLCSHI